MNFDREAQRRARRGRFNPDDPLARRRFISDLQRRFQRVPEETLDNYYIVCITEVKSGVTLTYSLKSAHKNEHAGELQPKFENQEAAEGFAQSVVEVFSGVKCWVLWKTGGRTLTVSLIHAGGRDCYKDVNEQRNKPMPPPPPRNPGNQTLFGV